MGRKSPQVNKGENRLRLSIKVAVLSIILAADLVFFIFFPTTLTDIYQQIFQTLPWEHNLELTIMLAIGLTIAIITSILLVREITKSVFKSIQGETNTE
jgi:hypothetical protein